MSEYVSLTDNKMEDRSALINDRAFREESILYTYVRPCLAEFLGTTFFVFLGTMATNHNVPLLFVAMAHAFGLAIMVAAMAKISGSHFNPAVSLGICLAGAITPVKVIFYVISQLTGAISGAAMTRLVLPHPVFINATAGGHTLGHGVTIGEGIACEIFLTAVLVLVILQTAVDSESQVPFAPLAIGFAVGADILAGGAISGASMNPARSFGPAVVASSLKEISGALWEHHYIYWIGPALGACFSALWYRLVFACPDHNLISVFK